jgi:ribosomal-protein-alanine N-acetyltransferase
VSTPLTLNPIPVNHPVIDQIFENPVFETERMLIGSWDTRLAEAALQIYGDPEVTQWIGGVTFDSVEAMADKIEDLIARNGKWPAHWGAWPAFCKKTRALVGSLLMKPLPDAAGNFTPDIEIGWHLGKSHWGRGLATEGGRRMIEIAFDQIGTAELSAVTGLGNQRSQNVALRLGLTHIGQTDAYYGQTVELYKIQNGEHNDG